ncbi:Uncharacterized protein HZ326_21809 [Fusarium oxysporum f. sp. albedinis]|nr:hypothetical protein HZ326_21910 [Fusarium oxysporum f. sp. albedinis]KAJ0135160.1 Uncharacterized protein HZ326_21809 [Fusarium oxysporum f. sp. albedinis]
MMSKAPGLRLPTGIDAHHHRQGTCVAAWVGCYPRRATRGPKDDQSRTCTGSPAAGTGRLKLLAPKTLTQNTSTRSH